MVIFSSCSATHFYTGFTSEDMEGMVLLGPCSEQYFISEQEILTYNDTLSIASESLIASLVENIGLPVKRRVQLDSDQTMEAFSFMNLIKNQNGKKRGNQSIPLLLDELLETERQRFGLLICANGYSRDTTGYAKRQEETYWSGRVYAISTGTMTMYYGLPTYFASIIYAVILDSKTNRIVYYNFSRPEEEIYPLDPKSVRMQLMDIFKDFYY